MPPKTLKYSQHSEQIVKHSHSLAMLNRSRQVLFLDEVTETTAKTVDKISRFFHQCGSHALLLLSVIIAMHFLDFQFVLH